MQGLVVEQLTLAVREKTLIESLTFSIQPGEVFTLMGPSGCGKSSVLSFICGTLENDFFANGLVYLNERAIHDLPAEQRKVGILFQDDLLFPHLSVAGNLSFALAKSLDRKEKLRRIHQALSDAGLPDIANRDPASLSGGQRARVALLRTLLAEPKVLLLDEPFSKLDKALREAFRNFVFLHAKQRNLPVLLVTHDAEDAHGEICCLNDID